MNGIFLERMARKRLGLSDSWKAFQFVCLPRGAVATTHYEVVGAECDAVFTRGPRKGETNWGKRNLKTERSFICSVAEGELFLREWEETGKCHRCDGAGKEWVGWSEETGHKHRECSRCFGTGNAPAQVTAELPAGVTNQERGTQNPEQINR